MSLSQQTIDTVKATLPVLAEQGEAITTLFYQKMFKAHPELKHVFNMSNQAKGEQKRALADAVFAYAKHIDKLATLGPAVSRIAHKHASLQVKPEQYPIVGKYLLAAIAEHLGLDSDNAIIIAWGEAYQALAAIFIETEEHIYQQNEQQLGGWRGERAFTISQIDQEAKGVKSFYLLPTDDKPIASWLAGQYIAVKTTPATSDYTEIRQYSLSNAPNNQCYRISVKAETGGLVSEFLHQAKVGEQVLLHPPTGDFHLIEDDKAPVLISGGVGITPLASMLHQLIAQQRDLSQLVFIQCCQDKQHAIYHQKLEQLSNQHGFSYYLAVERGSGDHLGYLTTQVLNQWLTHREGHAYFCGPKPFMSAIDKILTELGFNQTQRHYETFGPQTGLTE